MDEANRQVSDRTLWVGVQAALYTYRNSDDDMTARAFAVNFLTSMPAWMQQPEFRPPKPGDREVNPPPSRYQPTLLEYARVIAWLWNERHNIRPERRTGVHMADIPSDLHQPFDDALNRAALKVRLEAELRRLEGADD